MLGVVLAIAMGQASLEGPVYSTPSSMGRALLYIAYPGRSQSTSIDSSFCSTFSSSMTGASSFCMSGAGVFTGTLGSSFAEVGTVTDSSDAWCPNGNACSTYTTQRFSTSADAYQVASSASPTGDSSAVALVVAPSVGVWKYVLTKYIDAGDKAILLAVNSSNQVAIRIHKSAASYTEVVSTGVTISVGDPHVIGYSYDYVADGSSVLRLYVDGAEVGTASTTAVGPIMVTNTAWNIGRSASGSSSWGDRIGPVIHSEEVWPAGTFASMATALLPDLKTSTNASVSTSRTTVRTCANGAETAGTMLGTARECVDDTNRLHVNGSHSNLVVRSIELEQWTVAGTPTETANNSVGPFGTKTADLIGDDAAGAAEGETTTASVSAGAAYTLSCWAKSGTSSSGRLELDGTSCPITTTSTWDRYSCTDASSSGVSITAGIYPTDATAASTGNMEFERCQVNAGSVAAPFCPTFATAPVTCNADVVSISKPSTVGDTAGCMSATVEMPVAPSGTARVLQFASGGYMGITSSTIVCNDGTNTATANISSPAGRSVRARCGWSGSTLTASEVDVATGSGTYDGALTGATIYLGSDGTTNHINGFMSRVVFDNAAEKCR